jgi:hypothetical protein
MEDYIGLDVSMKETAVSVRRDGKRVWRGKCASDPKVIANLLRKHAPTPKRLIFETGRFRSGSTTPFAPKACRRSASMRAMPKRRSTWRRTRLTRTMQTAWRILLRSASTVKSASRALTACSPARWWRHGPGWSGSRPSCRTRSEA